MFQSQQVPAKAHTPRRAVCREPVPQMPLGKNWGRQQRSAFTDSQPFDVRMAASEPLASTNTNVIP